MPLEFGVQRPLVDEDGADASAPATAARQDAILAAIEALGEQLGGGGDPATETTLQAVLAALGGTVAMEPKGFEPIGDLSSEVGLTVPAGATIAVVQAEGADVRWRDDGDSPTASVGMILYAGQVREFTSGLAALEFIETVASATLNVSYYGPA